jgi:hypothetical protein
MTMHIRAQNWLFSSTYNLPVVSLVITLAHIRLIIQ